MSEELKYVECPNCKGVFDSKEKYTLSNTISGMPKFNCKNCGNTFLYPVEARAPSTMIITGILVICIGSIGVLEGYSDGDKVKITLRAILLVSGVFSLVAGLLNRVKSSKLTKEFGPTWNERFHNTKNLK